MIATAPDPLTTAQSALAKLRQKYPQYNNMADDELIRRVVEKYPVYRDTFAPLLAKPAAVPETTLNRRQQAEAQARTAERVRQDAETRTTLNPRQLAEAQARTEERRQQAGLLVPGNIDLTRRPTVANPQGGTSTVFSMSFEQDGKEILVPRVSDDGRILSPQEAIDMYRRTGKHLGIFRDARSATTYAQELHRQFETGRLRGVEGEQRRKKAILSRYLSPEAVQAVQRGQNPLTEPVVVGTQPVYAPGPGRVTSRLGPIVIERQREIVGREPIVQPYWQALLTDLFGTAIFAGGPTLIPGAAGAAAVDAAASRAAMGARAALAARRGVPAPPAAAVEAAAEVTRPQIRQTVVPAITMRPSVAPQTPPRGVPLRRVTLAPGVEAESIGGLGGQARRIVRTAVREATPPLPEGTTPAGTVPFKAAKFGAQAGNVIEQTRPLISPAEQAQRRGVLSDAAVDDLARMVGIGKDDLLKMQPGTAVSAEHIAAARQILKTSADEVYTAAQEFVKNPKSAESQGRFVDLIQRHGQIQVKVAGLASEAGRSLRQFRRILQETPPGAGIDEAIAALPTDLRGAAARIVGAGRNGAAAALGELRKPTWQDMVVEFGTAAKISGPLTQLRNVAGNTFAALLRPVERTVSGLADVMRSVLTGAPRERFVGEAGADLFGKAAALKDASRNFVRALLDENFTSAARVREIGRVGAIPGRVGKVVRFPFRFLTGMDEFFREINRRGAIYAESYRQAVRTGTPLRQLPEKIASLAANPSKEVMERASAEAAEYLFQKELGSFSRTALQMRNQSFLARLIFPFFRTPVNLVKFAFERSPLGVLSLRNIADIRAGGGQATDAIARITVGSAIAAAVAVHAAEGKITAGGPSDRRLRDLLYAQGWQPYSVKIGGRWVSYRGFDPLASFLSNVASYVEDVKEDPDLVVAAGKLAQQVGHNITQSTWLTGLRDLLDALDDPERYAEGFLAQFAGGFVPRALAPVVSATDPYLREAKGILPGLEARIPGLSRLLPERLDVLGRPIQPEGGPLRGLFPATSTPKSDPALAELTRLGVGIPEPPRTVRRAGMVQPVPEAERRRIRAVRGTYALQFVRQLLADPEYMRLDDDQKRQALLSAMNRAARSSPAVLAPAR